MRTANLAKPHIVIKGQGTPIVFVHGNGVDHRIWLDLDDIFAGTWQRIYTDLPGFGQTPALSGVAGLPELADWLDSLVGEVMGAEPFAIAGSSLGGLLARDLAARRRPQCLGLALLAPVVDSVRGNRTLPEAIAIAQDHALLESLDPEDAQAYAEMAVVQSPENWERFRTVLLPGLAAADPLAMERLAARYFLLESPDVALSGFDRPVLIVAGKQDEVVGFEDQLALSQLFSRATYAALDLAGHNIQIDQPETVRALLRQWGQSVLADRITR